MYLNSSETLLKFATLVELLRIRGQNQPKQTAFTFLQDGETESDSLTYQELDRLARAIAAQLQSFTVPGERALLLFPPGLEYIGAFFGCLYAGVVAVPAYPPRPNRSLARLQTIVADAQASVALTTTSILSNIERQFAQAPELKSVRWLTTNQLADDLAQEWQEPAVSGDTLAFLQYTSGSTAAPKGVMITHSNLLHNLGLIHQCFEHTSNSRGVIWLPPYHDMGLIGGVLQPLYGGFPVTLMSPLVFLQNPLRWLRAISHYQATTSGGPNFAYDLCVRKITPEQLTKLDLSSWEVAFNGAEPICHETLERFAATFEPCGFRRQAFYPCYGLAEATLIVSGGLKTAQPVVKTVQGEALEQNRVVQADAKEDNTRTLVGCGQALPDQQIAIVHPEMTQCADGQVGEIWVSGPSVAKSYWRKPEETQRTFHAYLADTGEGPFLRTGDLGFLEDGELFVTGRLKDVIIINGCNHYPQDIERTVEQSSPSIRQNCCAAFSVDIGGAEKLVVVAEVERRYHTRQAAYPAGAPADSHLLEAEVVIQAIRRAVSKHHDLQVHTVLLLKPGNIPKTSSSKIQRHACRIGFLNRTLVEVEK